MSKQRREEKAVHQEGGGAVVGVYHHLGWAVLVTVASDGTLVDRRRIELVDEGLSSMPYHGPGQRLPIAEAVDLVERVQKSADRQAKLGLDAVASEVPARITGIALRECPKLPPTIAERIQDYFAQCNADSVMYRMALAAAAEARGWSVHWYDAKKVIGAASQALGIRDIDAHFQQIRKSIGPPWNKDHSTAMAAAIVAAKAERGLAAGRAS